MKKIISIDLGGTRVKAGIVEDGRILAETSLDSNSASGFVPRLPRIEEAVDNLLHKVSISLDETGGVAISFPGIVDSTSMKPLSVNAKFNDAVGFDFIAWAREKWGCGLIMENDARCAMVGEWKYGAGEGFNNIVMVTLGTGVGGAAIIEGKLLRGKHFQAGCLGGHFTIDYNGGACNCGNIGCVETVASTWSLPAIAARHTGFVKGKLEQSLEIDYKLLFSLYRENDPAAVEIATQSMDAWSAAVINLIHAYDPEIVIIGGGIMKSSDIILPHITAKVCKHAWTPWGKVKIVQAFYADSAALPGAAYLFQNGASLYL